jgi:thymidylate synthase (FAD)
MTVELIDKMGSDLSVVNAARVSFDKKSDWVYETQSSIDLETGQAIYTKVPSGLTSGDERLIKFLATHNHWTPFGHTALSFHIKAPIFVARQLVKHTVGLVWNEVSRRYVDSTPEFYFPDKWRKRNEDKKQGSYEDQFVEEGEFNEISWPELVCNDALNLYRAMLKAGVCAEQARMVLPQNTMTEWYWSGSMIAFARVCNLRCKKDTQLETRLIANQIDSLAKEVFPVSWKYLRKE